MISLAKLESSVVQFEHDGTIEAYALGLSIAASGATLTNLKSKNGHGYDNVSNCLVEWLTNGVDMKLNSFPHIDVS